MEAMKASGLPDLKVRRKVQSISPSGSRARLITASAASLCHCVGVVKEEKEQDPDDSRRHRRVSPQRRRARHVLAHGHLRHGLFSLQMRRSDGRRREKERGSCG
ncbi:unnamed protein product [Urochloa humidicola]